MSSVVLGQHVLEGGIGGLGQICSAASEHLPGMDHPRGRQPFADDASSDYWVGALQAKHAW